MANIGKNPQQPELRRSELGATSQNSAEIKANTDALDAYGEDKHPVPEGNRPGWQHGDTGDDPDRPVEKFRDRES